jgi:hypothetical protein
MISTHIGSKIKQLENNMSKMFLSIEQTVAHDTGSDPCSAAAFAIPFGRQCDRCRALTQIDASSR